MPRILALDYGSKRIGLAISDEQNTIAQMLEPPLANKPGWFKTLAYIISKYQVEKIILGHPRGLSGTLGRQGEKTEELAKKLAYEFPVSVELLDERFTTKQAGKLLWEQKLKRKRARALIDNLSAQILLQAYLDRYSSKK